MKLVIGRQTQASIHGLQTANEEIRKFELMWKTKYASALPKNLGLGLNFRPCSEGYFLSGRP